MYQPIFSLTDLMLIFTCFGCIFLTIAICASSNAKQISSRYLIAFFLSIGLTMGLKLLLWVPALLPYRTEWDSEITFLYFAMSFFKGGALYLYVASITESHFKNTNLRKLLLTLPVPIALLYVFLGIETPDLTRRFVETTPSVFISYSAALLLPCLFSFWCISRISKAKKLLEAYASEDTHRCAQWLTLLVITFIITWTWELFTHFVSGPLSLITFETLPHYFGLTHDAISALSMIFLYIYSSSMAFKTLNRARLFDEQTPHDHNEGRVGHSDDSTDEQALQESQANLVSEMLSQSLHLEKKLNIDRFSKRLGYKPRRVSQLLNDQLGMSFSEFINHYRVEHAKMILSQNPTITIAEVMNQSGFNSESSFYRIFKKMTGDSPKLYR